MRKNIWVFTGVIVFLILVFGGSLISLYTDWLWFGELGYTSVFRTQILSRVELGLIGGLLFFLIVYSNLWLARRFAPASTPRYDTNPVRQRISSVAQRGLNYLILGITIFVSIMVALETSSHWMSYQMFTHPTAFGRTDPIFGNDIGFYIFKLGFMQYIYGWVLFALIVAAIATAAVHYIDRAIDMIAGVPQFAPHVKAHLSMLFAAVLFVKAWGYRLDAYSLLYSSSGKVFGAGYTDVHARMVAFQILSVVAVIAGILALVNIKRRGIRLPAAALIILVGASVLIGGIYPALMQQFFVAPNQMLRETPYIANNIAATRQAFDLEDITVKDFPAEDNLSADDLRNNQPTIKSIRLWDYRPLQSSYNQLQAIGPYFHITNVDVDRYMVKSELRQVMLAARELSIEGVSGTDNWVNRHFRYTHGYGAVMSPVNESSRDGSPSFWVSNMPPKTTVGIDIARPQVYFGEMTNDYAIANSNYPEYDHQREGGSENTKYQGSGGIGIGSYLRRLAFAWRFADINLVLNSPITSSSRLMYRRLISERVKTVFPFMTYDHDPYLVISKGKLYWIQDAYTTSNMYPYSTPIDWTEYRSVNYVRNSVKVVIDAYDGSVDFYASDAADPMLKTYGKIFPGVFKPMNKMPDDLRNHVRYPEDLFNVQSAVMRLYHVTDPQVFYAGSDRWEIPNEVTGTSKEQTPMDAYYVVMDLPGESSEEFVLMRPFTPTGKNNMVSWMGARCDPENYGKLVLYLFPTQSMIYGPSQIESRIDQNPAISSELTLWNQQGSSVNRGNLIVIPVAHSILYIKPIYLESTTSKIPQLKRVIVAYADRVEMADTLDAALQAVFGSDASPAPAQSVTEVPSRISTGGKPSAAISSSIQKLIDQANIEFKQAEEAQRKGDWAAYGQRQKQLQQTLQQLQLISGR